MKFDLVGLPPTPEEISAFDSAWNLAPDKAIADVVDRLLESEHFGERWGRHWLDVARYAESSGRGINMTYPQAWRYRDYVIDSFNADKPFDRFVQEQLAGDLLPVKTDEQWAKNLIATTFLAIGSKNVNEDNRVQFAADVVDEQIDATTRVFMGTSVACARCHDHKFDPIPQADYYAMAGIFNSMKTYFGNPQSKLGSFSDATEKQTSTLLILPVDDPGPFAVNFTPNEIEEMKAQMEAERQQMAESRRSGQRGQNPRVRIAYIKRMAALSASIASVDDTGKAKSFCMGVQESTEPADAKILVRGEIDQPAQSVSRGLPQVLTDHQPEIEKTSSGRLELARWIGSDQNTLTARVMVNRIWLHLIGKGIVTSTENFGATGQMPSHPELLDQLAVKFVESGWSVKSLVREIANSRVYRISSEFSREHHEYDPGNALVWRANPRRLDAEAIRDAMLQASGELDTNRPAASLIAKVGYTRVQSGRLTPARGPGSVPSMGSGNGGPGTRAGPRRRGTATRDSRQDDVQRRPPSVASDSRPTVSHPKFSDQQIQFFEQQVRPILTENCNNCHGGNRVRGGLQLISRRGLVLGGDQGSAIDDQSPNKSLLLKMISYADANHQMPPSGKLSEQQIDVLTEWVDMNAPWSKSDIDLIAEGGRGGGRDGLGRSNGRGPGGGRVGQGPQESNPLDMESAKFRSVYLPMVRDAEPRSLRVFDFADSSTITGQRETSNTANQSLYMMNNPFVEQQSRAFAKRLRKMGKSLPRQIDEAVLLTYGRRPTPSERDALLGFAHRFSASMKEHESSEKTMSVICQSLFASAEFRYID